MLFTHRTRFGLAALLLATNLAVPVNSYAQQNEIMLVLEPHCAETDRKACAQFETEDESHLRTPLLNAGDILDIDIVLTNGTAADIQSVKAWLKYDSKILEGRSVQLSDAVKAPAPGEQNIYKATELIKIGGDLNPITGDHLALARITFRVIASGKDTVISFHNFQADGNGQTAVNGKYQTLGSENKNGLSLPPCADTSVVGCRAATTPFLYTEPSKLNMILSEKQEAGSSPNSVLAAENKSSASGSVNLSSSAYSSAPSALQSSSSGQPTVRFSPGTGAGSSTFSLLQVQNLRVTTRDNQIFLGFDALTSSELSGYNVYYGTVSGQYIQRRTIPPNATSLVLRDLEPGTVYFLAVRAFNAFSGESAFSQEVSVTVGRPETSTSPLTGTKAMPSPAENPITTRGGAKVTGDTGIGDNVMFFALISACIGTAFAFARQLTSNKS